MLKIGDFSKLSRISIRMLRHYDETGLLVPETVDEFSGYRYYSETQLLLAEKIQVLKNLGFSLALMNNILKKYDKSEEMEKFLLLRRAELEEQRTLVQQRLALLDNTVRWLRKDGNLMNYSVTLKTLPERTVASVRRILPAYDAEGRLWQILNEELKKQHIQTASPRYGLAIFHDEGFQESGVDVEIQLAVNGSYRDTENVKFLKAPAVNFASATFQGGYEQITRVNHEVVSWINENGYEFDGCCFCIYHVSPNDTNSHDELVTEVCCPVRKKQ